MTLTVGGLFAGIGGFELGLERAGMDVRWHSDVLPFAQHILKKNWPDVPVYGDIKEINGADVERVDVLCGGFPCQDISNAGKRAGIEGARSSLWKEYKRLVDEIRPRYVIVENVAVLRRRGLDVVLGDLSALGYDAEWDCLRASDFGAWHRRDRLWLVAYPSCDPVWQQSGWRGGPDRTAAPQPGHDGVEGLVADAQGVGQREQADVSNALSAGRDAWFQSCCVGERLPSDAVGVGQTLSDGVRREWRPRVFGPAGWAESAHSRAGLTETWTTEPDVGRVADGVPARVDRLTSLGNALIPQIAQWIGERILAYEGLEPLRRAP